jgi:hypothetical protein
VSGSIGVADKADRPRRAEQLRPLPTYASSPAELSGRWLVARVRSNHEGRVIRKLDAAGIGYFLPLQTVVAIDAAGKRRRRLCPLFIGYVFACVGDDQYEALAKVDSIFDVIRVSAQQKFLRELSDLHAATESGFEVDPFPFAVAGARCRITSGRMRGVVGHVVHRDGHDVLVLQIEILGESVGVDVDPSILEPA